jgi:hypothetical protein
MTQINRKKVGIMKEEMIMEELVILGVIAELIYITHLLYQQEGLMNLKIP